MPDLSLEWKSDFVLTAAGDLLTADGPDLTRQRIERRLFTAVKGYIWHMEFGAGLPERIGRVAIASNIRALVQANMLLESTVASVPVPVTTVDEDPTIQGLFIITINYADAATGEAQTLAFDTSGQ